MRTITKGPEPPSLTAYRQTPGSNYDGYTDKAALRAALILEQYALCCYCMGRIRNGELIMKIEHWQCRHNYRQEQLNYRNLLGACLGGKGNPPHLQHCDTRKDDDDLKWNPADPAHQIENRLCYTIDGSIRSNDADFDAQLDDVLNLNLVFLKNNRKGVLDAVLEWWKMEKARLSGPIPLKRFEGKRKQYLEKNEPHCQVGIWWLDQRLARMRG